MLAPTRWPEHCLRAGSLAKGWSAWTGDVEPVTTTDITDRYRHALQAYQASPVLMDYVPYTDNTRRQLERLASLKPRTLAAMHGSTFVGDGAALLTASIDVIRDVSAAATPLQVTG